MIKANQEFKSLSEFSENVKEIVGSLKQNGNAIILTQNEKNEAVLLNFKDYEKLVEL